MTDRRAFKVSLCIGLLLFVAGVRGQRVLPPCENQAHAQEVPTLAGEHSIRTAYKLELPDIEAPKEAVPVGKWFVIGMPEHWKAPDGVRVKLTWVFAGYEALPYGPNRYVPFIVKAGEYTVVREATWATTDDQGRSDKTFKFTVGDPPPDRPLSELAGKDAAALSIMYVKFGASIPQIDPHTPDQFWLYHTATLKTAKLEANGAASAILDKLKGVGHGAGVLDDAVAKAAVDGIVNELGRPTPPPPVPPGPVVTAKKLWLIAIDDAETRTPTQTVSLSDVSWMLKIRAAGHDYEHYETGSADASKFAAFIKFPDELVIEDAATGKVLGVDPLPVDASTAWLDSEVAKYSGAK